MISITVADGKRTSRSRDSSAPSDGKAFRKGGANKEAKGGWENGHRPLRLWAAVFWLFVWQLGSMAVGKDILLASPLTVLLRLARLAVTADFWRAIAFSLIRIASGFLLAAVSGCVLAALSARFRWVEELLAPAVLAVRSIPVASFIILALIWFSSKNLSVLISFLMVFPVIYANVLGGIRSVDGTLLEMGQVFGLSRYRTVRYLYLPQVMPYFDSGCTAALGLCWKSGIAAEVIGIPQGSIGEKLQRAKVYLETPDLFAWTLVIVLASFCFERLVLGLIRRLGRRMERI